MLTIKGDVRFGLNEVLCNDTVIGHMIRCQDDPLTNRTMAFLQLEDGIEDSYPNAACFPDLCKPLTQKLILCLAQYDDSFPPGKVTILNPEGDQLKLATRPFSPPTEHPTASPRNHEAADPKSKHITDPSPLVTPLPKY